MRRGNTSTTFVCALFAAACTVPATVCASPTTAVDTGPSVVTHAVSAEYIWLAYATPRYPYAGQGVGVAYRASLPRGLAGYVGMRGFWGAQISSRAALEGFVGAAITPAIGEWMPWIGLEIGYSGVVAQRRPPNVVDPHGTDEEYRTGVNPVFAALVAAPLRMRFGQVDVAALELHVGTTLPHPGRALRLALVLGQASWRF
jgi:hypothetical protein